MSFLPLVRCLQRLGLVLASSAVAACGSSGGGGSGQPPGTPGTELAKPDGGTFFLDPHHEGRASRLHLIESAWGRLVDVHGLLASGDVDPLPAFQDMLIEESVQSDSVNYRLETNAITQRTRLVILRQKGAEDQGGGTFEELLARARQLLPPIVPKPDDGSAGPPFSFIARNGCLSLRFDDLLDDGPEARVALRETVRTLTGYPPTTPFITRILFDPNHGGVVSQEFHSTRVLIDASVSEEEAAAGELPLEVNSLGFPGSFLGDPRPNVSVRIPALTDPGSGQFRVLTNLLGAALDRRSNGPVDTSSPTLDVVRAMRSGRVDDANNGFLLDLNRPELIGAWPAAVTESDVDPLGAPGVDFVLALSFGGVCKRALGPGDILQVGEHFLEVRLPSPEPDAAGFVAEVHVRLSGASSGVLADELLGNATYLSTFAAGVPVPATCWVNVVPAPGLPPDKDLLAESRIVARFSEPMSRASVDPFDNFRLSRGNSGSPVLATTLVVADVVPSRDLKTFTLEPFLPLAHGTTGEYTLAMAGGEQGLTDLAGNEIAALPPLLEFELDPDLPTPENGGIVLRFGSTDELEPVDQPDLRGQLFYDFSRGTIRGRLPAFESFSADRSQPVPGIMIPFAPGVQTPLSSLGSKLQYLWRHCDLGWSVEDESKHNLDVIGLSWSPVGGTVLNDFFERFEMRLAHSRRIPDEFRTFVGTTFQCSGLGAGSNTCPPCNVNVPFEDNILRDPRSPQKVVHERSLGYRVDAKDLFLGVSGARRMPWPLNRSGVFESFTWRDTSVLSKDGIDSGGIPLMIETALPLAVVPGPAGRIAQPGKVPAWGLPLLIEVRCFPSNTALGFNPLEIYLAQNSQALPNFRAYSTGGINQGGLTITVNPDLSLVPSGGFNPGSRPPGQGTTFQADNSFYTGELDSVVRVSRAHSIWMPVTISAPHYLPPLVSPLPGEQLGNAKVELEFRGADGFTGNAVTDAFDARHLDPLGDVGEFDVQFHRDVRTWTSDIGQLDGAGFLQMRITFVNDIVALVGPELSAIGIAYTAH